jgi:hypothetical protein
VKASHGASTALLLFGLQAAFAQSTWLSDEQARNVASAEVRAVYPQPCFSTYRDEHLESRLLSVRRHPIVGNHLNDSVYFYRVASDACEYVIEKDRKQVLMAQVSLDCCDYGLVAVDRSTTKSYWFSSKRKTADVFKEFVEDEQLQPDSPPSTMFTGLYLDLVWGEHTAKEITSLAQLQDIVQSNFRAAYSPYERDTKWQRKFDIWWRQFRRRMAQLKLETTYEPANTGTIVRGYGFSGFELTIPRSDPPPKGTPTLFQWNLLLKPDGTVDEQTSKTIYSSR